MSIEQAAIAFVAATKKRAQARSHLSALRKKWLAENDAFWDKYESDGMEGHNDMLEALHDREQANAEYRRAKSRLFRACPPGVATPLSDFIRNASPERKAEVFGRVMDNVTERQQAVIAAAGGVPAVDARAAEVMRLADAFAEASAETARGDDDAKDPVLAREALARALGVNVDQGGNDGR